MVLEWVALIVAFGIFFGTIINKFIDYDGCCSGNNDDVHYEHLKSE